MLMLSLSDNFSSFNFMLTSSKESAYGITSSYLINELRFRMIEDIGLVTVSSISGNIFL